MIANQNEFDESLRKLGELYEEGKDHLNNLIATFPLNEEVKEIIRLYDIIREMRDLAAVTMQKLHFKFDN